MTTKKLNSRQARWAEALSEFNFLIAYRAGSANAAADALSRREQDVSVQEAAVTALRSKALLKRDQIDDRVSAELHDVHVNVLDMSFPLADQLMGFNKRHDSLQKLRQLATDQQHGYTLEDGLLLHHGRLVVPDVANIRTDLVREAHAQPSTAHPGSLKTYQLLKQQYVWKGMKGFITQYVANCHDCQKSHVSHDKTPGFLHPLPVAEHPWQHICIDLKSMPKDKYGYDTVAVFIDRFSKKAVSIPCYKTATAIDLAELYYEHCFRHQGLPDSIVSDRGPQFVSEFWGTLCALLQIKRKLSTAYHPETDGQTEIMNQYLDLRLRPFVNHFQDNWSCLLPLMDFAQLALHHESLGTSPFELLHGRRPRLSIDWRAPKNAQNARQELSQAEAKKRIKALQDAWSWVHANLAKAQSKKQKDVNKHRREPDFQVNDRVWLSTKNLALDRPSKKLGHQKLGPFRIVAKHGWSYELELPESMKIHNVFHAKLLRKAPDNPVPGQLLPTPDPLQINDHDEWEVDSIRASKLTRNKLSYRANWLGADEDPEYYPASNFMYSPHLLKAYHIAHPLEPGPPKALPEWLKAWEAGTDDYDALEDDKAMTGKLRAAFFREGGVM